MVENIQAKRLLVLGQVGCGKSYLLNILGGSQIYTKQNFEVASQNIPCTSQIKIVTQLNLLGMKDLQVDLIDLPGLFSSNFCSLEAILEECNKKIGGKINQLLVVVNINSEFTLQSDLLFKLAKKIVPDLSNITLIFTKVNEINKYDQESQIIQWNEYLNDFDFKNVFYFGNSENLQILQYNKESQQIIHSAEQQFVNLIRNSQPVQLVQYNQLLQNDDKKLIEQVESSTNFLKKNIDTKILVTFGQSKQGKSHLLNLLLGYCENVDSQDEAPFTVSEANQSCTNVFGQVSNQLLFGPNFKEDNVRISVLDTPGVYNTQDTIQHQKQKQSQSQKKKQSFQQEQIASSLNILADFESQITNLFNRKMGRILLVIDSTSKFDEFQNNVIKIVQIIASDIQRILVMITKTNFIDEEERPEIFQSWIDGLAQYNLKQVYFVGENLSEIQIFQNGQLVDGKYHLYSEIKYCSNVVLRTLHDQEKQEILKFFLGKEGCFSLDNQIYLEDGRYIYLRQLKIGTKVLNLQTKQNEAYLTALHVSHVLSLNFLQIKLELSEKNQNLYDNWELNQIIEISENHLIFVKFYETQKEEFIKSKFLQIGDQLFRYNTEGLCRLYNIVEIQMVTKVGYIAPLTESGTIFVNGFLSSCYSPPQNWVGHKIAQFSMIPLIKYKQLQSLVNITLLMLKNKQIQQPNKQINDQENKKKQNKNDQANETDIPEKDQYNRYAKFLNNLLEFKQSFDI